MRIENHSIGACVQRSADRVQHVFNDLKMNLAGSDGRRADTKHTQRKHWFSWWRLCRTFCMLKTHLLLRLVGITDVLFRLKVFCIVLIWAAQPKNMNSFFFLFFVIQFVVDLITNCVNKITSKWTFLVYFSRRAHSRAQLRYTENVAPKISDNNKIDFVELLRHETLSFVLSALTHND